MGLATNQNSDDFILKNKTHYRMLDDADATNTKPIENFFGNWDREIVKTGPKGFQKAADDLIIKYARDNIAHNHQWRTKANREKAKLLKAKEVEFNKTQQQLAKAKLDNQGTAQMMQQNQVLRCVAQCKEKHNGPVTSVEELKALVNDQRNSEKDLHKSLNLEIRLQRLTFTKVSKDNMPIVSSERVD